MTATSLILLGNYGISSSFYLYTIKKRTYYSINDINNLFLNEQLNTKTVMIKQLFISNSNDFLKSDNNHIFIHTNALIQLARALNIYTLAELCKLTNDEILGGVSDPLLNTISDNHKQWKSASPPQLVVERDLSFESLHGDEPIFTMDTVTIENTVTMANDHRYQQLHSNNNIKTILLPSQEVLYRWLSTNLNTTNSPSTTIKTLLTATKVKKQQQAIIETRQRQVAFIIPTNNNNNNKSTNKKQKLSTRAGSHITPIVKKPSTTIQHDNNNSNYLIKNQYDTRRNSNNSNTAFPPSPPAIINYTTSTRKRKMPPQQAITHEENKKRTKLNDTHSTSSSSSYQQYLIHHGNDNLNLLATQATQMRGLPISPEVSPSPPPFYNHQQQQQRLPSIQVMLSELNHHSHNSNSV